MVVLLVELHVVGYDLAVSVFLERRVPGDADGVGRLEVVGEIRRWTRGLALLREPVANLLLAVAHMVLAGNSELVVHSAFLCNSTRIVNHYLCM